MNFRQKDFVIYSVFVYILLLLLVFLLRDKQSFKDVCYGRYGCVRFCCHDIDNCNEKFIKEHFNASLLPPPYMYVSAEDQKTRTDYRILYGSPTCNLELNPPGMSWEFTMYGGVKIGKFYHDPDTYCLEHNGIDGRLDWNLYICRSIAPTQKLLHFILMSISVILLAVAISVYAYFKPLKADNQGKISICFLTGCLFTTLAIPLTRVQKDIHLMVLNLVMFVGGLIFMMMWYSVMCFDIWYTFRRLQPESDGTDRFKYYWYYIFGVLAFLLLTILIAVFEVPGIILYIHVILLSVVIMFLSIAIASITFLIIVGVKIFRMSKSSNYSGHVWIEEQKTRFWSCIQILGIITITAPIELLSMALETQFGSKIVIDLIKLVSAFLLFAIFVLKEKPRKIVFKRYDVLVNVLL